MGVSSDAFRVLGLEELDLVAGGQEEPVEWVEVTAKRMTAEEHAAYRGWQDAASFWVGAAYVGSLAVIGAAGYAGWAGAGGVVGEYTFGEYKDEIASDLGDSWFQRDKADGTIDGKFDGHSPWDVRPGLLYLPM